jgi:hypothetical protein
MRDTGSNMSAWVYVALQRLDLWVCIIYVAGWVQEGFVYCDMPGRKPLSIVVLIKEAVVIRHIRPIDNT